MECRICLEKLFNSVALDCGHTFCEPCVEESKITLCPICRCQFKTKTQTPWFDCRIINDSDESEDEIQSEEIKDPRGHELIRYAENLRNTQKVFVSNIDKIISNYEQSERNMKDLENREIELIRFKYQKQIDIIRADRDKNIEVDQEKMKCHEYANENLVVLADTCIALSKQSSDTLNVAVPIYKPLIDQSLFKWPLGMSLLFPEGNLEYDHYGYITSLNRMCYANHSVIFSGTKSVSVERISYIRIVDDRLYVQCLSGMHVFDYGLFLVKSYPKCTSFFVEDGKIFKISERITRYEYSYSSIFSYLGFSHVIPGKITGMCDVHNDKIYLRCETGTYICDKFQDVLKFIERIFFFYKSKTFHSYKHVGNYTHFMNYALPGNGHIFPGARDTVIYKCGNYGKLLRL